MSDTAVAERLLETVDTKVIARSPFGIDAFTKFPSLKEKFMLALTIDRALADERAALSLPDLGKVSKPDAGKVSKPATRKK